MFGFEMLKSQKIFQTILSKYFLWSGVKGRGILLERTLVNILVDLHEACFWRAFFNGLPVLREVSNPLSKGYTVSQHKILIGIPAA